MDGSKWDILLVEDDEVDVAILKRAFKKNDIRHNLHVADNGMDALALLRSGQKFPKPRLILLDLNMPKMSGFEFLEELRKDPTLQAIPVFVLTTSNQESDLRQAYQYNVSGYILKPVSSEEFVSMVGTLNAYWDICEFV